MKKEHSFGLILRTSTLLVFALSFSTFNLQASETNAYKGGDLFYSKQTIYKDPSTIQFISRQTKRKIVQVRGYTVSASATASNSDIKNSAIGTSTTDDPCSDPTNKGYCLKVTSPNGGEAYNVGDSVTISWQQKNIDQVTIGYKTCDSCLDWIANNLHEDISTNPQTYQWTVPSSLANRSSVKIYVIGYKTGVGSESDTSDAPFSVGTVTPPPASTPTLSVTAPSGLQTWTDVTPTVIRWATSGFTAQRVNIYLVDVLTNKNYFIARDIPNTFAYTWDASTVNPIPEGTTVVVPNATYKVEVLSNYMQGDAGTNVMGIADATITIQRPSTTPPPASNGFCIGHGQPTSFAPGYTCCEGLSVQNSYCMPPSPITSTASCVDTDGGANANVWGKVSGGAYGTIGYNHGSFADYCNQGSVVEYFCSGNGVQFNQIYCPNGCTNGACNVASTGETTDHSVSGLTTSPTGSAYGSNGGGILTIKAEHSFSGAASYDGPIQVKWYVNGNLLEEQNLNYSGSPIYPGVMRHIQTDAWTNVQPGSYTVKVVIDANNAIAESSENNNSQTAQITVGSSSTVCALPGLAADVYGGPNHVCCAGLILEGGICNQPHTNQTPTSTAPIIPERITVCHKTGSGYTEIETNMNGWTNGHSQHEGDYIKTGLRPCKDPKTTVEPLSTTAADGTDPRDILIKQLQERIQKLEIRLSEVEKNVIEREKNRDTATDPALTKQVTGRLLLQVQEHGEVWYVDPVTQNKFYLKDGDSAYQALRAFGTGISESDFNKLSDPSFVKSLKGKILLRVETDKGAHGEAYYVDQNGKADYLKDGDAAYEIMRSKALGITNDDLSKVPTSSLAE